MKKLLTTLFCAIALFGAVPFASQAQVAYDKDVMTVARSLTTDTQIAIRVKFVGTVSTGSYSIAVAAGGDITVEGDDGAVDSTVGASGVIDVSDTAYDTFGEVCDEFNSSDNWQCVIVDVLPGDSSNDTFNALSETGTGLIDEEGLGLFLDTSVASYVAISIGPEYMVEELLTVKGDSLLNRQSDPFNNGGTERQKWTNIFYKGTVNLTHSGAGTTSLSAVYGNGASATTVTLWTQTGAATGVDNSIDMTDLPPLYMQPGWRLVLKGTATTATAGTATIYGQTWRVR